MEVLALLDFGDVTSNKRSHVRFGMGLHVSVKATAGKKSA